MLRLLGKIIVWTIATVILLLIAGWFSFVPGPREPAYEFIASWGTKGNGPGQFDDPTGIAIAGAEVFVSDARNGRIQVFDLDGRFLRTFGKPGKGAGELGRPMNLHIRDGRLYVPEYFNDRIQVFTLDGTPSAMFGKSGSEEGDFNAPGGVSVGADGAIYVADFYNHRIQKLAKDGAFIRQWGKAPVSGRGSGSLTDAWRRGASTSFSYPTDVAVTKDGWLFVADGYNDRVQAFKPDGSFSHRWGGPFAMNIYGPFNGWFTTVTSIAIGPEGNIFVADFYNNRVQKFTPDGTFLTSFGHEGSGDGELQHPIAIDVGGDGTVFVADYGNNRITKWRPSSPPS